MAASEKPENCEISPSITEIKSICCCFEIFSKVFGGSLMYNKGRVLQQRREKNDKP